MAKISVVLSQAQTSNLISALQGAKQSKTVEAIIGKVGEAVNAAGPEAKKVPVALSPAQVAGTVKALGTVPKQTKTVEALAAKFTEAIPAE